jgi:hypothetical protein
LPAHFPQLFPAVQRVVQRCCERLHFPCRDNPAAASRTDAFGGSRFAGDNGG